MNIPPAIARKIHQMLTGHLSLPASTLKSSIITKMIDDGVISKTIIGTRQQSLRIPDATAMHRYLLNKFGITDLTGYITRISADDLTRTELITLTSNSKTRRTRTFEGFLVNSYMPIQCKLNGNDFVVDPTAGSFIFISDYQNFLPDQNTTIVGIENPENFRQIRKQVELFESLDVLFVSRYPYSSDLLRWLQSIPNKYLHFGDLDFAGIEIFRTEYEKYLGDRAEFFVPKDHEQMLRDYGNRELYLRQDTGSTKKYIGKIAELVTLFHKYQKVLEQEIFIRK